MSNERHLSRRAGELVAECDELGALVLQKRMSMKTGVVLVIFGLVILGGSSLGFFLGDSLRTLRGWITLVFACIGTLAGVLMTAAGIRSLVMERGTLLFHERGVRHLLRGRLITMLYEDFKAVTFTITRMALKAGVHVGYEMILYPSDERKRITVFHDFPETLAGDSTAQAILDLRDLVSRTIMARIERDLAFGEGVAWSDNVRVFQDGLELPASNGGTERIPWARIRSLELPSDAEMVIPTGPGAAGLVRWMAKAAGAGFKGADIRVAGEKNPRVTVAFSERNFYPLLMLVEKKLASR